MSELEVKPNINQPGVSGLQDFGRSLAGKLAPNEIQERVRATPHGIFVEKDFTDKIAVLYAEWLKEKTGGEVQRSQAKCFKRLFGSLSPAWLYLVEAKCCLVGALVKIELPQPEILGLPAYRGTLDDTRRLLHPRDPLLQCMPHVTLHSCQGGLVFEVTLGRDRFRLDSGSIREFTRLTRNWRGGSESNSALREGFKGLITSLGEARPLLTGQSSLVPMRSEGFRFLTSGPLVFAFTKAGQLARLYRRDGKGLNRFILAESAHMHRERLFLPFEAPRRRSKVVGVFRTHGAVIRLGPAALLDFVRGVARSRQSTAITSDRFTLKDCLNALLQDFSASQRIEREKVSRFVRRIPRRVQHHRITQRWIFSITRSGDLIACADRFNMKRPRGRQR